MTDHRLVELPNIVDGEGFCSCGCGKDSTPELLITLQASVFLMARERGKRIRVFWYGARCQAKNQATRGHADRSLHLDGEAADTHWEEYDGARWVKIPSQTVAAIMVGGGVWGGVGWNKYENTTKHTHLDLRDGKNPVIW